MTFRARAYGDAAVNALAADIEKEANRAQDFFYLRQLNAEPSRLFDGMLVWADGSNWNPGSGAGIYHRRGSAWVHLG